MTPSRHTQRRPVKHTPRKRIYAPPPLHEADDHRLNLTSEQRLVRRETALHEATHLGVALELGGSWQRAFIRMIL